MKIVHSSTLAFQDVVAKVIPARRRGSFFGTRQLMGGLLTFAIAGALSNLLWGRVSERQGNRRLLLIAGALLALTPAAALLAPTLEGRLWPGAGGLTAAMGLVFLVSGIANDASNIAGMTYMLEIVPEAERPTYIGLANTTLGLVTFLPVLGGWLIAMVGYAGTFGVALSFALLGLAASLRLTEADAALARRAQPIGREC